jgi:hypothetical protein
MGLKKKKSPDQLNCSPYVSQRISKITGRLFGPFAPSGRHGLDLPKGCSDDSDGGSVRRRTGPTHAFIVVIIVAA